MTEESRTTQTCPLCKRAVQMRDGNIKPHRPKRGPVNDQVNTNACKRIDLRSYRCDGVAIKVGP